jgi:hypothetical protein
MQPLAAQLDRLSGPLAPLREAALRYASFPGSVSPAGVLNICHRPWVAELNYMFMLYPGIDGQDLAQYCQTFGIDVPAIYSQILTVVNGAFCFGMSLYGVPASMLNSPPRLDRSVLQCHDLATAATSWRLNYEVPDGYFHFGSRHYSYDENAGYFHDDQNRIISTLSSGEVVGEWADFAEFLTDELKASEELEERLHPKA